MANPPTTFWQDLHSKTTVYTGTGVRCSRCGKPFDPGEEYKIHLSEPRPVIISGLPMQMMARRDTCLLCHRAAFN